ncbi:sirohydrochlorin chelatase [Cytobacillus spongiae]|uniref:sirohydrochlorin chelatase n=1 Tax=Cytobacillus spongiae TaxID=2901381 RepID=UPI001F4578CE|nr:sirohydrochlorin chelatase [Cytobacillus spongiae]UII56474.1 sirohydrochlorin chelatase [Cytobacillus spongiae]
MEAILFVGHGGRSPVGNQQFIDYIEAFMSEVDVPIKEFAFHERVEPNISQAIAACVEKGATDITVVPVLLLPGLHANIEIPKELTAAKETYQNLTIHYSNPIGINEKVIELLEKRLMESGFKKSNKEAVLLLSHGSPDPVAATELQKASLLLQEKINTTVMEGYLTSSPLYADQIKRLLQDYQQVYIIPYLFFMGGFKNHIEESLSHLMIDTPKKSLTLCECIGYVDELKPILKERVHNKDRVLRH